MTQIKTKATQSSITKAKYFTDPSGEFRRLEATTVRGYKKHYHAPAAITEIEKLSEYKKTVTVRVKMFDGEFFVTEVPPEICRQLEEDAQLDPPSDIEPLLWEKPPGFNFFGLFFILTILGLPAYCVYTSPIQLSSPSKDNERTEEQERGLQVVQAERIVKGYLKDPKSAEFSGLYHSGKAVCGAVNAKNSFGGYTGYTRFITRGRAVVMDDGSAAFSKAWADVC